MMGACVRAASYMLLLLNFISVCSGAAGVHRCSTKERRALLEFKQALTDPSNRLSSWSPDDDDDCCQWAGVGCHNITGAVTLLDLHNDERAHGLGGYISHSLFHLESLSYLDLSGNDFQGTRIPSFLGSMKNIRYLNLYDASFGGLIPNHLQNLSNIRYLNLGYNEMLCVYSLGWIAHLRSLEYLDMSRVNLHFVEGDWLQSVSMPPSLFELNFSQCLIPTPGVHVNFSSLQVLDLSRNRFISRIPDWLFNLSSSLRQLDLSYNSFYGEMPEMITTLRMLEHLDLGFNPLTGSIPPRIGQLKHLQSLLLNNNKWSGSIPWSISNLTSLRVLDLSSNSLRGSIPEMITTLRMLEYLGLGFNRLTGSIPPGIGQLKHLQSLTLYYNKLNGSIPWSFGNLTSLRVLRLSHNQLGGTIPESIWFLSNLERLSIHSNPMVRGVVSEAHLSGLSKLKVLSLSSASLSLSVSHHWTPPFQLEYLALSLGKLGPAFPSWLQSQTSLQLLDISMSGISDTIPDWFWKFASGIPIIKLSGNQIHGDLTHAWFNSTSIDISSNCFDGQLPQLSPNVKALSIRNNSVSGRISTFICGESNRNNKLEYLDISMNSLSGELSECWMHWQSLVHLNLGSNNLSGTIPSTIGSLYNLKALQLSQNRLFGDIPWSLRSCSSLGLINLGENQLSGPIPYWIGNQLSGSIPHWIGFTYNEFLVLRLRSNKFTGSIPEELCQLPSIHVLDLGNNNLSGTIPKCLSFFSSMVDRATQPITRFESLEFHSYSSFREPLELVTKGTELIYESNLGLVKLIDFSNNMLSGTIPTDISRLSELHSLNLSRNQLVGEIPKEVGDMSNLESLDLSRNQLSGEIPESMSKLSFLSHLDMSYNNLSGSIPSSTQFQSFSESSFLGNVGLCGAPLSKNCRDDTHQDSKPPAKEDGGQKSDDMFWFYIGVGPGFACAFCGFCSTLYFNKAWRQALFGVVEDTMDNVYVFTCMMLNRIKRRLQRDQTTSVLAKRTLNNK